MDISWKAPPKRYDIILNKDIPDPVLNNVKFSKFIEIFLLK